MKRIKADREMGVKYLIWQEMLSDERKAGYEEGLEEGLEKGRTEGLGEGLEKGRREVQTNSLLELLEELGQVPLELRERIQNEQSLEQLQKWFKIAVKSKSIEEFRNNL